MKKYVVQSDFQSLAWYEAEAKKIDAKILELKLARPALRALVNASIYTHKVLLTKSISELSALHGMGPSAIKKLQQLLFGILILSSCIFSSNNIKAQSMDRMYRIAKIKVDVAQLEKYKTALEEQMHTAIKLEPGVLSYTAVSDKVDKTLITIFEVYANHDAYQTHILTTHFKKYKETVKDMVLSLELIDTELVASDSKANFK